MLMGAIQLGLEHAVRMEVVNCITDENKFVWMWCPGSIMGPLSICHGTAQHVIARIENETRWVARVLAGTFLSHMAGRSLPFHSPVRFLFAFFSEPWEIRRPLQLSLIPTLTLHSWISLHLISSGLHWACVTHCTIICAVLTIDDLEGREAYRSCSWLLTEARQRPAVDVFPRGDSEV